ncbi:MAG: hypothetical protein PHF11_06490 [Candidatus Omnitrophica bacterium]|nr:hypothetical protein [Candidatus Omnitrophota bacterium]
MKLKLNVYPAIQGMEEKISGVIQETLKNRAKIVEIAYGEATDSVKKRILNFLTS